MTSGICENEFQPSLRDSFIFANNPTLKRRSIFVCPFGTLESLSENPVLGGTGNLPVLAGYQPARFFGGKLPPKTGW
jgi:hypothetical protein